MKRRMFGHRLNKRGSDLHQTDQMRSGGHAKDNPPNYEGHEHVKYGNPGYSSHEINIPEDEPHMKSHIPREEEHEMEDNYHMGVPHQTDYELEKQIKRAKMHMDAPDQEDVKPLRGNITHNVPMRGEEDSSGEEMMGPNDMQDGMMGKEHRKKMIVAVMKRKMKKKGFNKSLDEEMGEDKSHPKIKRTYAGLRNSY